MNGVPRLTAGVATSVAGYWLRVELWKVGGGIVMSGSVSMGVTCLDDVPVPGAGTALGVAGGGPTHDDTGVTEVWSDVDRGVFCSRAAR